MAKISFYGGVGSVTGSKYLLEHNGKKILVDCGLFQGERELRERNWHDLPFDLDTLDAGEAPEGLVRQLERFIQIYIRFFHCSISCYTGHRVFPEEIPLKAKMLVKQREENAGLSYKVFFPSKILGVEKRKIFWLKSLSNSFLKMFA